MYTLPRFSIHFLNMFLAKAPFLHFLQSSWGSEQNDSFLISYLDHFNAVLLYFILQELEEFPRLFRKS
jgi:hypothetical protein